MPASSFVKRPMATVVSAASLALVTGSVVAPAYGQESFALEEVVVTAQKREESLQDAALSITALSETMIEQRGIFNSQDLIGEIPGIGGYESPGARGSASVTIRGVAGGSPGNVSLDPAVALYLDGVFLGKMTSSAMDVVELERVEVLRGPQGTLYGRNSTGGAINFVSRKPTGEFGLRATGTVGDYDLYGGKLNLDLPAFGEVGEGLGQIAVSAGLSIRQRDPFYDNVDPAKGGFDDIDREGYRLAVRWMPTDNFTADYAFDYNELNESNQLIQIVGFTPLDPGGQFSRQLGLQGALFQAGQWAQIPGTDPRITERWIPSIQQTLAAYNAAEAQGEGRANQGGADFAPFTESEVTGHNLTMEWEFDNFTLRSITGYRDVDNYVFGDLEDLDSSIDENGIGAYTDLVHLTLQQLYAPSSGFAYPFLDSFWDAIDNVGADHSKQDTRTEYEQFSQEFNLIGSTDSLDYVLGLYWFQDDAEYSRRAIFAAPLNGTGGQFYDNSTDAWAVFGQTTWNINDKWEATVGLRYTNETKEIDYDYEANLTPFGFTPARQSSLEEDFSVVTGEATLAYQATDDVKIYARYARGYRSGGFNGEVFENAFDEETVDSFEIGLKSDWLDGRARLNANLWTYTYEDLQVSQILTSGGAATSLLTNAGEAERWGVEIESAFLLTPDMLLNLSYSHISGDFEEFPDICGTDPTNCLTGEDFAKRAQSPDNMLSVSLDWAIADLGFAELTAYVQANWQDEWYETALWQAVVAGQPVVYDHQVMDERTIVNGRINLENISVGEGNMRVSLWGRNLTDDDYPTFAINYGGLGPIAEQYGAPRMWGIDFTYEY